MIDYKLRKLQSLLIVLITNTFFYSSFLYPEPVKPLDIRQVDGQYEVFTLVEKTVKLNLSKLISAEHSSQSTESLLAGAIAMALCYIVRMQKRKLPGSKVYYLLIQQPFLFNYVILSEKLYLFKGFNC